MARRLDTLMRLRQIRERAAAGGVGTAEAAVAAADGAAAAAARERLRWAFPAGAPMDVGALHARQLQLLALHDAEALAQAELEMARHHRDRQQEEWRSARVHLRSTERLVERRRATMAAVAAARAQAAADELAVLRQGGRR
jgi:flagellar export protein FliJ